MVQDDMQYEDDPVTVAEAQPIYRFELTRSNEGSVRVAEGIRYDGRFTSTQHLDSQDRRMLDDGLAAIRTHRSANGTYPRKAIVTYDGENIETRLE